MYIFSLWLIYKGVVILIFFSLIPKLFKRVFESVPNSSISFFLLLISIFLASESEIVEYVISKFGDLRFSRSHSTLNSFVNISWK